MDLGAWWRSRKWRGLLELIDMLPQASRYYAALVNDPEQAAILADLREQDENSTDHKEPWSPSLADWDLHAQLMRDIIQTLFTVRSAIYSAAGGKPGNTPEYPTPVTEVDRIMARREIAWANSVLSRYGFGENYFH